MKTLLALILTASCAFAQLAPSSGSLSTRKATPTRKKASPPQPQPVYVVVPSLAPQPTPAPAPEDPAAPIREVRELHGTDTLQGIQDAAAAKWPGNYDMQKYEIEKQARAFSALEASDSRITPSSPPAVPQYNPPGAVVSPTFQSAAALDARIAAEAAHKWPGNYDMQGYEIKKQNEARLKLGKLIESKPATMSQADFNAIVGRAARKWDWNIDMVVYDMQQQLAAWRKLNP